MSALQKAFAALKEDGRKGFIPYITAGDPDLETTCDLMLALAEAGATAIELGVPFSDPMADGPVIQAACERALRNGARLADILELARRVHSKTDVPIVLFSYLNPLLRFGLRKLADGAAASGIAGVLVTDLPAESAEGFSGLLKARGLDLVTLVSPTTSSERLRLLTAHAGGFLYAISVTGVTGARSELSVDVEALIRRVREVSTLPVAIGFGIAGVDQARQAWRFAEAVVVGSAIVRIVETEGKNAVLAVRRYAGEIVSASGEFAPQATERKR